MLLGAPEQPAPVYELDRVRDVVLAVNSAPVDTRPLAANRDFSISARLTGKKAAQQVLLWVVLVGAVVVLAVLTLRLVRREAS